MYTNEMLIAAQEGGAKLNFVFFWGEEPTSEAMGPYCMSHWYLTRFEVDNVTYITAEQYMMAQKALLFGDKETFSKIMSCADPTEYKAFGRQVRNFDPNAWEANKVRIVKEGNLAKFSQNAELKEYLLSTGASVIAEAAPDDSIWGIGLEEWQPEIQDPRNWKGENLLGYILMEVRDELAKAEK